MPRYPKSMPGNGFQISEREEGIFLQARQDDGSWRDVSGPYTQRGSAYARYRREIERRVRAARAAGDTSYDDKMRYTYWEPDAR